MIRTRMTYVPLEVAEKFGGFIVRRDEEILGAVKAKTRDYSTLSLLKLLYQVRERPMTFTELYSSSKIRMKRSFMNYLRLCVDYSFVERRAAGQNVFYAITDRGMIMLGLFMRDNN